MPDKLKPCPFCGEEPDLQFCESTQEFYLECANPNCDVELCTYGFDTEKEAIAAWTRRGEDEQKDI